MAWPGRDRLAGPPMVMDVMVKSASLHKTLNQKPLPFQPWAYTKLCFRTAPTEEMVRREMGQGHFR